ncbi:NAD-dependent epimerase/dehydratase family protein [Micromonospora purpureochromogenes]|uniref:NAD-dependent epimerase/dehydratase family protein n=1 Tax=Micromonospora purpureochromogenes TaxID=47872 RepID=UPI0038B28969
MARVRVTAAARFIGPYLVDALLSRGVKVVGLDRRGLGDHGIADENLAAVENRLCTPVCRNLSTDQLGDALDGCDTVFHLAARPGVRPPWAAEFVDYAQANVLGTNRLLDACVRSGFHRLCPPRRPASAARRIGPTARPTRPLRSRRTPSALQLSPHQQPCADQHCPSGRQLLSRPLKVSAITSLGAAWSSLCRCRSRSQAGWAPRSARERRPNGGRW